MKKILLVLCSLVLVFTITGCGATKENQGNNGHGQKQEEKENNNQHNNSNNNINNNDDEIIDIDEEDNKPVGNEKVTVEKVINCDGCVYAYFSEEGNNAKRLGDKVSANEYTTDINNIRTKGNKQRHNFFGLVLSGNTISKAYSCILKDNKIIEKEIPTLSEIDEIKVKLILNDVQNSKENLNKYIKIIENNKNKNFSDLELAAALLKKMREN